MNAQAARSDAIAVNDEGVRLADALSFEAALAAFRRSVAADPTFELARVNLGVLLCHMSRPAEAQPHFDAVVAGGRASAQMLADIGGALRRTGRARDAMALLQQALALDPECGNAHVYIGGLLMDERKLDAAERRYRRAFEARPTHPPTVFALSQLELLKGDFASGWRHYEAREDLRQIVFRRQTEPRWLGEPAPGKTVLLACEQGYGDSIQFTRYAPRVVDLAGRVVLRCQPGVGGLFRRSFGGLEVIEEGEAEGAYDLYALVGSLPGIFGTTPESIPAPVPYLAPNPAAVVRWRERLKGARGLRVGVCWRGNPMNGSNHARSLAASALRAALDVAGVSVVSLQKDASPAEVAQLGPAVIADAAPELTDFDETAALVAGLDLVISPCTAMAHLAGALGVPTWTLLSTAADWRWLLGRDDTPWYPTMRLFRQKRLGDWAPVLRRVRGALEALTATAALMRAR